MAPRDPLIRLIGSSAVVEQEFRGSRCVEWTGWRTHDGYGMFRAHGRRIMTHRFSYEYWVGPIPGGLQIDHLCRNRACMNPSHLEPVTAKENHQRGEQVARTHCPQGHPYAGENLYVNLRTNNRTCKTCRRAAGLRYLERKRNGAS